MLLEDLFSLIGKIATTVGLGVGGWLAIEKWWRREEHFPRIELEVGVNFLGVQDDRIVCELVASVENKGVVPLKYKEFTFVLRGLSKDDSLKESVPELRNQINFFRVLARGQFVPSDWEYSFSYPSVKTEYKFAAAIPTQTTFVRMQADLIYLGSGESHHAAKILRVPSAF